MVMDAVLERFIEQSPVTAMAHLALQRVLEPAWIDRLFERHRQMQYTRELLFSTTVDLMGMVAMGLRPSLHAAMRTMPDLPVSMHAIYDKIRHTEPAVIRALVQGSAQRLAAAMESVREEAFPTMRGYRIRIIDGNHSPASEKRLKPLRAFRGAALPGQSLVIYEPESNLVIDIVPGEDAHASERSLAALAHAQSGRLWIVDRHFSIRGMLAGWQARGCGFIVREHSVSPHLGPLDPPKSAGRIETGSVQEQTVTLESAPGQWLTWPWYRRR